MLQRVNNSVIDGTGHCEFSVFVIGERDDLQLKTQIRANVDMQIAQIRMTWIGRWTYTRTFRYTKL